jgi:hypothetical protein
MWENSPQYLKNLQKIRALPPDRKAIVQDLVNSLGAAYADRDMQKRLESIRAAATERQRAGNLALANRRLATQKALTERGFDLEQDRIDEEGRTNKIAEGLGYGNIFASGLSGVGDLYQKRKQAKFYKRLARRLS